MPTIKSFTLRTLVAGVVAGVIGCGVAVGLLAAVGPVVGTAAGCLTILVQLPLWFDNLTPDAERAEFDGE